MAYVDPINLQTICLDDTCMDNPILYHLLDATADGSLRNNMAASENREYQVGEASTAIGYGCKASGWSCFAEGANTIASAPGAHAEGYDSVASGNQSHAEGYLTTASGMRSHAEGMETKALNEYAHAEGFNNVANAVSSHAEGQENNALGEYSHAEGRGNFAIGSASHVEGDGNQASGKQSHAEGLNTIASGINSHAGGAYSKANGIQTFAHGDFCSADYPSQAVFGQANVISNSDSHDPHLFIVGNGGGSANRSNAFSVSYSGVATASSFTQTSDERLKEDFKDISAKDIIMALNPVDFKWKHEKPDGAQNMIDDGKRHFGMKAQEVQDVIGDDYSVVSEASDGYLTMDYIEMIPVLIKLVQEQQAEIEALKSLVKE